MVAGARRLPVMQAAADPRPGANADAAPHPAKAQGNRPSAGVLVPRPRLADGVQRRRLMAAAPRRLPPRLKAAAPRQQAVPARAVRPEQPAVAAAVVDRGKPVPG